MSNKIEITRELAERILQRLDKLIELNTVTPQ